MMGLASPERHDGPRRHETFFDVLVGQSERTTRTRTKFLRTVEERDDPWKDSSQPWDAPRERGGDKQDTRELVDAVDGHDSAIVVVDPEIDVAELMATAWRGCRRIYSSVAAPTG